MRISTP